jgi:hypothetical protein
LDDGASLTVAAHARNVATAAASGASIGVIGGAGMSTRAEVLADAATSATIGWDAAVTVTGAVVVDASLIADGAGRQNFAGAASNAAGVGALGGGEMAARALAGAPVTARLDGDVLHAGSLNVLAAGRNDATASTSFVGVGAVSSASNTSSARVTPSAATEALVGADAEISSGGAIAVTATSANVAHAFSDGTAIGVLGGVAKNQPTAAVDAPTRARLDGDVGAALSLRVAAHAINAATAESVVIAAGVFGAAKSGDTHACIGAFDDVGGGCGAGSATTEALVGASARLGSLVAGLPTISGAIAVEATAQNTVIASSSGGAGGVVGAGSFSPTAIDTATTLAALDGDVGSTRLAADLSQVGDPGASAVSVVAAATDATIAKVAGGAVGIVSSGSSTATATTTPTVTARLGAGGVVASGRIDVSASSQTDADAYADSGGGGAVQLHGLTSTSTVTPAVNAIVAGGFVQAGETLSITASHGNQPVQLSDGTITLVDLVTDTLTFNGPTGLTNGQTVVYQPPGAAIGGLVTGATYGVITTGANTLMLGTQLTFGGVCAGAGALTGNACVDVPTATLKFAQPHNLHDGDIVDYRLLGGASMQALVGGVVQALGAGKYVVVVVDANTIRLRKASTPQTAVAFTPTAATLSSNTLHLAGHGFANDDAVTYHLPHARQFDGNNVDVTLVPGIVDGQLVDVPLTALGAVVHLDLSNLVYVPNHGYRTGDRVVYDCQDVAGSPCSPIGGLTRGTTYGVVAVGAHAIKLTRLSDGVVVNVHQGGAGRQTLTPVDGAVGGLVDGRTYYVQRIDANNFRLRSAPGGATIAIAGTGFDTHRLSIDGIALRADGTSTQQLVVDLTSLGGCCPLNVPNQAPVAHVMLGIGGAGAPVLQANVPTASSSGIGIGLVGVGDAKSFVTSSPTVTTDVQAGSRLVGRDVVVSSASAANGVAVSSNGGGLVAVGSTNAQATIANTVHTKIGAGSSVRAVRDLQIVATSTESPSVQSRADGGLLAAGADANADASISAGHDTSAAIDGAVTAGRTALIEARDGIGASFAASSSGALLGRSTRAGGTTSFSGTTKVAVTSAVRAALAYVSAQGGAQHTLDALGNVVAGGLAGEPVQVDGPTGVGGLRITARAASQTAALLANSRATARIDVDDHAIVELGPAAFITAGAIEVHARHERAQLTSDADAGCACTAGLADADAHVSYASEARVSAPASSAVRTTRLLVDVFDALGSNRRANAHGGLLVDHHMDDALVQNVRRTNAWSATTFPP